MGSNVAYSKSASETEKADTSFSTTSASEWGVGASANARVKMVSAKTDGSDNLVLYKTDRHVWPYPILSYIREGEEAASLGGGEEKPLPDLLALRYPSIVQGDTGQSSQFDDSNPIHEEDNLFSYPTKVESTPCYREMQ